MKRYGRLGKRTPVEEADIRRMVQNAIDTVPLGGLVNLLTNAALAAHGAGDVESARVCRSLIPPDPPEERTGWDRDRREGRYRDGRYRGTAYRGTVYETGTAGRQI